MPNTARQGQRGVQAGERVAGTDRPVRADRRDRDDDRWERLGDNPMKTKSFEARYFRWMKAAGIFAENLENLDSSENLYIKKSSIIRSFFNCGCFLNSFSAFQCRLVPRFADTRRIILDVCCEACLSWPCSLSIDCITFGALFSPFFIQRPDQMITEAVRYHISVLECLQVAGRPRRLRGRPHVSVEPEPSFDGTRRNNETL
jgi:hypothetical protein